MDAPKCIVCNMVRMVASNVFIFVLHFDLRQNSIPSMINAINLARNL
jgi:hypothetical protein